MPCGVALLQGVGVLDCGWLFAALRSNLRFSASSSRCRCKAAFLSNSSRSLRRCSARARRLSSSSFLLASSAASSASLSWRSRSSSERRSVDAALFYTEIRKKGQERTCFAPRFLFLSFAAFPFLVFLTKALLFASLSDSSAPLRLRFAKLFGSYSLLLCVLLTPPLQHLVLGLLEVT